MNFMKMLKLLKNLKKTQKCFLFKIVNFLDISSPSGRRNCSYAKNV